MRTPLFTVLAALAITATASAQALKVEASDADGTTYAVLAPAAAPYTTGEPSARIPALSRTPGSEPTAAFFRIRAWREGDGVRVLVFVVPPAPQGTTASETQIASVLVPVGGKAVEVSAEKYDARSVLLVARQPVIATRYTVGPLLIDIPVRPWEPPPRGQR